MLFRWREGASGPRGTERRSSAELEFYVGIGSPRYFSSTFVFNFYTLPWDERRRFSQQLKEDCKSLKYKLKEMKTSIPWVLRLRVLL